MGNEVLKRPLISVVIPAYNEEALIGKCLTHLKKQDLPFAYEIIVVNGPSTDRTKLIAQKYASLVIDQDFLGIGQARNQGCRLARGEIIAITDADVFVPPDWLSKIYHYFHYHQNVVAVTGPYTFTNSRKLNNISKVFRPLAVSLNTTFTGSIPLSGTNMAIRRKAYFSAGEFDPLITGLEDIELGIRLSKLGEIAYLKNLVVQTTARRFNHPTKHIIKTFLPTYFKRILTKNKDQNIVWKPGSQLDN